MKDPGHGYLADLVVKAQGNDTNAFSELYALTYDKVYNYSRSAGSLYISSQKTKKFEGSYAFYRLAESDIISCML